MSIRGTSCSTGTFDAFTAQEWSDGAAAIEWAARQPWSNGHLGMLGDSFPGITQVGVAGLRPPHLDAIAPFQVTTDLYRDVGYPGGITNTGFGAFWAGVDQPNNSYRSGIQQAVATGDAGCAAALATHLAAEPTQNIGLQALQHPYVDDFWHGREPGAKAARINIPTFGCLTWQDDETSSRGSSYLSEAQSGAYVGRGHQRLPRSVRARLPADNRRAGRVLRPVREGQSNGFERTPHIQLWHDTTTNSAKENVPSWITSFKSYTAIPVQPLQLYFRPGGELALTRPKSDGQPDRYAYPGPCLGNENGIVFGQNNLLWKGQEPPGASLAYTTPPLSRDAEFFGSGSANIWMSSTAPDTDLQITLTEVRPDGQEVYIARGWLRAAHRPDRRARRHLQPAEAVAPLVPGEPTRVRVRAVAVRLRLPQGIEHPPLDRRADRRDGRLVVRLPQDARDQQHLLGRQASVGARRRASPRRQGGRGAVEVRHRAQPAVPEQPDAGPVIEDDHPITPRPVRPGLGHNAPVDASTSEAIKREKKRLPFGWGRFGKALDRLGELLEPGEVLEFSAIGVYSQYREQHPFGQLGAGQMNVLLGVTDRRLFVIGTALSGKPLDHHAIAWADLTEFAIIPDKKRAVAVAWPGGAVAVDSVAKSAFGGLSDLMARHN